MVIAWEDVFARIKFYEPSFYEYEYIGWSVEEKDLIVNLLRQIYEAGDTLLRTKWSDFLSLSEDTLVLVPGFGQDRISDFQAGSALTDVIRLSMGPSFDSIAEVLAVTVQVGGNSVITFSSTDSITLTGINKSALVANDFLFV